MKLQLQKATNVKILYKQLPILKYCNKSSPGSGASPPGSRPGPAERDGTYGKSPEFPGGSR